ncbi:MAG: DUF2189 domain-containing protein [Azospirillum sp.]|nr:DUF2189 domain-containing protein [Azospirillum sp.]
MSIRTVGNDRPWVWLAAGWRDLSRAPQVSLSYGAIAVAISFLLAAGLGSLGVSYLILPMAAGFMLVAPVLGAGLYETSRRHELGQPVALGDAFGAYRRNRSSLIAIGLILMLALLAWIRIALLIFALFFADLAPAHELFLDRVFYSGLTIPFLVTGTAAGFFLAAVVFSISVVSIPMLIDRNVGTMAAISASVTAVRCNPVTMIFWAGLITLFTAAGLATGFVGLALALPLIGHASWHAYRDVVADAR